MDSGLLADNAGSFGTGAGDAAGETLSAERGSEGYDFGPEGSGDSPGFSGESGQARNRVDQTRAFSQRLNARLDGEIAGLGIVDETGKPIRSKRELDAYRARQTAQTERGGSTPPGEVARMKDRIAAYERQSTMLRQHESLSGDPKFGEVYRNNREAIRYLADNIEGLDLEAASMLFVRHNLDKITEQVRQRAASEALSRSRATFSHTPGSLSGGGDPPDNDIAGMSPSEFDRLVRKAERGELKRT